MEPTRIYVKPVLKLMAAVKVKGLAHITGGGLVGNVPRMLPQGMRAVLRKKLWPRPEMFNLLQKDGNVTEDEMHRVFNCGIGMVICVAREHVAAATMLLKREGELAYESASSKPAIPASPKPSFFDLFGLQPDVLHQFCPALTLGAQEIVQRFGVPAPSFTSPRSNSFCAISGSASTRSMSRFTRCTTAAGVPVGASSANQPTYSKPA